MESGDISVEVIGRRRCEGMEIPCQLEFNYSNKVLVNKTLERTTDEQDMGLETF